MDDNVTTAAVVAAAPAQVRLFLQIVPQTLEEYSDLQDAIRGFLARGTNFTAHGIERSDCNAMEVCMLTRIPPVLTPVKGPGKGKDKGKGDTAIKGTVCHWFAQGNCKFGNECALPHPANFKRGGGHPGLPGAHRRGLLAAAEVVDAGASRARPAGRLAPPPTPRCEEQL